MVRPRTGLSRLRRGWSTAKNEFRMLRRSNEANVSQAWFAKARSFGDLLSRRSADEGGGKYRKGRALRNGTKGGNVGARQAET